MTSPLSSRRLERSVQQRLVANGVRLTKGRRAVLAALQAADGPRSVAELHSSLGPEVPLSSLYRTLAVLEACDVVDPHHGLRGITRYELAEWIRGHHHHVVCTNCGTVDDVELDEATEKELARLIDDLASSVGLDPSRHTLEIEGRCHRC